MGRARTVRYLDNSGKVFIPLTIGAGDINPVNEYASCIAGIHNILVVQNIISQTLIFHLQGGFYQLSLIIGKILTGIAVLCPVDVFHFGL